MTMPFRLVDVHEAARRSGAPVALLVRLRETMHQLMNDAELRKRVTAQYVSCRLSMRSTAEDWYTDPDDSRVAGAANDNE